MKNQTSKKFRNWYVLALVLSVLIGLSPRPAMAGNDQCWEEEGQVALENVEDINAAIAQIQEDGTTGSRLVLFLAEGSDRVDIGIAGVAEVDYSLQDQFGCVVISANGRAVNVWDIRIDSAFVVEYAVIYAEDATVQSSPAQDESVVFTSSKIVGKISFYGIGELVVDTADLTQAELALIGNSIHMPNVIIVNPESDAPISVTMVIEGECGVTVVFDSLGQYLDEMPGYLADVLACESPNPEPAIRLFLPLITRKG